MAMAMAMAARWPALHEVMAAAIIDCMTTVMIGWLLASAVGPADIDFDAVTVVAARDWDGKRVRTAFVVGCPAYTFGGVTVVGPGERDDGVGRSVYMPETDADEGDAVTVEGVLRVRHHPAAVVNKQVVPAWEEIRIEDAKFVD